PSLRSLSASILYLHCAHRVLLSFPTRRSSDLHVFWVFRSFGSSLPSLSTPNEIILKSTATSRTCSTSRIQREVIQANGQAGSNQNLTDCVNVSPYADLFPRFLSTSWGTITGCPHPSTVSPVMVTWAISSLDGRSNIIGCRTSSIIERNPRAPLPRASAFATMALSASSSKCSCTPSSANIFWYCLISALRGSVNTRIKEASSR